MIENEKKDGAEKSVTVMKKVRSKKGAVIFLCSMAAALVILLFLNAVASGSIGGTESSDDADVTAATAQTYPAEWFDVPDYDADITADADYTELDRKMHYTVGNESFTIDGDADEYGSLCVFWDKFFDLAKAGEEAGLTSMHTSAYLKKFGDFGSIAPQKIYNIRVELLDSREVESGDYKGTTVSYFLVSYCIKDNNGTLRNDFIDDNVSVPLIYEIVEDNGELKINNYSRRSVSTGGGDGDEESGGTTMIVIAVIVIMVIIAAAVAIGFATGLFGKKKRKNKTDGAAETAQNSTKNQ